MMSLRTLRALAGWLLLAASMSTTAPRAALAQGCDACLQAAAVAATTEMTAGIGALQTQLELNTQALERGLEASTARIEIALDGLTTATADMYAQLIETLDHLYERQTLARQELEQDYTYGPTAMPRSLNIHADRAASLREAWARQEAIWSEMQRKMAAHQEVSSVTRAARIKEAMALTGDENVSLADIVLKRQMPVEDLGDLDNLVKLLLSPDPAPGISTEEALRDPAAARREVNRRLQNAREQFAYGVLSRALVDMQPLIERDGAPWAHTYVQSEGVDQGMISWREFLHDETQGRLQSESWFMDLRKLNQVGLLREQVVLQSLRNHVLARTVQREEEFTVLLALLLAGENSL